MKSKARRKELIKRKAEIHEIEHTKTIDNTNDMEDWLFENSNKIHKLPVMLTKKRKHC